MSKIAITGGATGTGVFSVVAPSTSTDRTLTLPDSTGTMATAESTLAQFNATGAAPVYACRAWVNFNGTGTVAIRASGNVSSITDNGTGNYTVNFTTAMQDANYCAAGQGGQVGTSGTFQIEITTVRTTVAYRFITVDFVGTATDSTYPNMAFFR